ncbi:helix-turn-helix transcriptional regulator [uncultured Desulfosarcina sp.]|uniref:helix-turn-helix domain-containing protein n=1 Tax=uncultured Desulfosarcina sp. TaxID=218289 RepID=UPI0029C9B26B|nr:helix-turn-helix transcriptional regulator [uncultured Desulfosarcina sp.]
MHQIMVSPGGLGVVLRELRKKKGLTQAALGARVGLDQKRVSLIENGNPNVRVDSLFRLFSALEVGMVLEPKVLDDAAKDGEDRW